MPRKKGLALMILAGGKKKSKADKDDKKALLAACGTFARSIGLRKQLVRLFLILSILQWITRGTLEAKKKSIKHELGEFYSP